MAKSGDYFRSGPFSIACVLDYLNGVRLCDFNLAGREELMRIGSSNISLLLG